MSNVPSAGLRDVAYDSAALYLFVIMTMMGFATGMLFTVVYLF